MKKSKYVELVLITAALASCNQSKPKSDWEETTKTHVRSDTTAPYTRIHHGGGIGTALLWYYAFRPYGIYRDDRYQHAGHFSGGISPASNIGRNGFKSAIVRGGFGRSGFSVGG